MNTPPASLIRISRPILANYEVHFSAYGPDWGFRAYSMPIHLVIERLGAMNLSSIEIRSAFATHQDRITQAVLTAEAPEPGRERQLDFV
jgi:hypothetical protein